MRIAVLDVDNYGKDLKKCFPNIALMKLSAWHKEQGDSVEWYDPDAEPYDKAYVSKVFSFSNEPFEVIHAREVQKGGSGYCISLVNGKEIYDKTKDSTLPPEIEHHYPDYDLYGITDTAYGFMSRGCPRGCDFCHVKDKEGRRAYKVANLSEFWNGQPNIELMDPNTLACKEWKTILMQLAETGAWVNFNQGIDIRLMTEEKAQYLSNVKVKHVHFAYDRYQDKPIIEPKMRKFKEISNWKRSKVTVYVLCGFDTTMSQNLERIEFIRSLDWNPYVMLYDKEHIPKGHELLRLQRWCNNKMIFWSCPTFDYYLNVRLPYEKEYNKRYYEEKRKKKPKYQQMTIFDFGLEGGD